MKKIQNKIRQLDQFGDSVGFTVKKGQSTYTTWAGAVVSLIIFALITLYGSQGFIVFIKRDDTKYETYSIAHENFKDSVYKGKDINFNVAFTVWGSDSQGNFKEFTEEELDGYFEFQAFER